MGIDHDKYLGHKLLGYLYLRGDCLVVRKCGSANGHHYFPASQTIQSLMEFLGWESSATPVADELPEHPLEQLRAAGDLFAKAVVAEDAVPGGVAAGYVATGSWLPRAGPPAVPGGVAAGYVATEYAGGVDLAKVEGASYNVTRISIPTGMESRVTEIFLPAGLTIKIHQSK